MREGQVGTGDFLGRGHMETWNFHPHTVGMRNHSFHICGSADLRVRTFMMARVMSAPPPHHTHNGVSGSHVERSKEVFLLLLTRVGHQNPSGESEFPPLLCEKSLGDESEFPLPHSQP